MKWSSTSAETVRKLHWCIGSALLLWFWLLYLITYSHTTYEERSSRSTSVRQKCITRKQAFSSPPCKAKQMNTDQFVDRVKIRVWGWLPVAHICLEMATGVNTCIEIKEQCYNLDVLTITVFFNFLEATFRTSSFVFIFHHLKHFPN